MRRSRYSEEQMIAVLRTGRRRGDRGSVPAPRDLGRDLLQVAAKYGGMEVSDAKRLKALEDENRRLKKLLAEWCWTMQRSRTSSGKTSEACGTARGGGPTHRATQVEPAAGVRKAQERMESPDARCASKFPPTRQSGEWEGP